MAAKKKPTVTKTAKVTTVKDVPPPTPKSNKTTKKTVTKKPAAKSKKKPVKKVAPPKITEQQFMAWFMKQKQATFKRLTEDWNEQNLKISLKKQKDYDSWLNYFKTLPVNTLIVLSDTGMDILPAEAYAALSFWRDIMQNPSRIKNIHRAGLTTGGKQEKTIVDHAKANNRLAVLEAIRDGIAEKLQQGAGARDAGQLSAQMMEVMTQIDIQKRKEAPKAETPLGSLLADMPTVKRPSENGKGHRHTSYASKMTRVTIKDLEGSKDGKSK